MVSCPGDWEEVKLSDIGYTYSGLTGKTKADFETGNGKFITFLNVLNNIKIDIKILGRVSIRENERQNAVNVGDLFFNTSSETPEEVGMCAVLLDNPGICYLNSFCFGYRLKRTDISPLFLSYYFNSGVGREFMRIHAQGSTRYNLSKQSFLKQSIHIPTFKEQTAIADTLAVFDTHIANLTELISKKKAIREGALDELMTGQTRLKGFCGDWEYFTIDDITDNIITGGTPSTTHSEYWGGTIPWLTSTEVHQKHITKPTTYITDIGFNNSSAKIAPGGSVIIALAGQGKTRGTAALLESSMALNQSLVALVTNDKCNNKFLFYLIENMYLALRKLSSGDGGRGGLNKKLIRNIKVHIPPINEQTAIADTLSALDKEISSLETERDKISQIRDGAMNDLLTGKVRLKIGI